MPKKLLSLLLCLPFALLQLVAQKVEIAPQPLRCGACQQHLPSTAFSSAERSAQKQLAPRFANSSERTQIDLLIVYDLSGEEYAQSRGGIAPHAQRIIERCNTVFANSHLNAQFRLAGTFVVQERVPSVNQGTAFGLSHQGIANERRRTKADIIVLCSEPFNDGLSGDAPLEAKASAAITSVRASAAYDSYTVIHEIGHIFGCEHSRESHDGGTHPYAVGASRAPYYTVMGFPHREGLTELVPIFSGLESVWKGVVLGSETENCVRKIRERMAEVAAFDQAGGYAVNLPEWNIGHQAQSTTVQLTTETFYFIKSSAPWLTASINNGYGNKSFTLSATANTSGSSRTATLTIEGDEEVAPVVIRVTQRAENDKDTTPPPSTDPTPQPDPQPQPDPVPTYQLDREKWEIDHQVQNTTLSLTTKGAFTLTASVPWLKPSITKGKGSQKFQLSAEANPSSEARTATLTVQGEKETKPFVLTVSQKGKPSAPPSTDPTPKPDPDPQPQPDPTPKPYYKLSMTRWEMGHWGENTTLTITSNTNYTITPSHSWLKSSIDYGKGNLELLIATEDNPSPQPRTATLTIKSESISEPIVLTVVQGGRPDSYVLDRTEWNIDYQAQTTTLELTTQSPFTLISNAAWLKPSITKGEGSQKFQLSAEENPSTQARTAILVVQSAEEIAPIKFTVVQKGRPTLIPAHTSMPHSLHYRDGKLQVQLESPARLAVYDAHGRCLLLRQLDAGQHHLPWEHRGWMVFRVFQDGQMNHYKLMVQ